MEENLGTIITAIAVGASLLIGLSVVLSSRKGAGASGASAGHAAAWNQALIELGQRMGLQHHPSPVAGTHDSASGTVAGRIVSLSSGGAGMMDIDVHGRFVGSLLIHRRDVACTAFAPSLPQAARQPTPLGVPDFDAWFTLCGADVHALHALRTNQELRALLSQVVATMGAQIHQSKIKLVAPVATSSHELVALLEPMIDLALWLSDPAGPRPQVGEAIRGGSLQLAASLNAQGPLRGEAMRRALDMLGGGQTYYDSNESTAEWRGELNGFRVRVVVDAAGHPEVHLKIDNPAAHFNLTYDRKTIPSADTASDPNRVFVGRGIFFAQQAPAEVQMAAYQSLAPELTDHLCRAMHRDGIMRLWFDRDELASHYRDSVAEMLDPIGRLWCGVQLLAWAAPQIGHSPVAATPLRRVSCQFCRTIFIHGRQTECPNCGAPNAG